MDRLDVDCWSVVFDHLETVEDWTNLRCTSRLLHTFLPRIAKIGAHRIVQTSIDIVTSATLVNEQFVDVYLNGRNVVSFFFEKNELGMYLNTVYISSWFGEWRLYRNLDRPNGKETKDVAFSHAGSILTFAKQHYKVEKSCVVRKLEAFLGTKAQWTTSLLAKKK